MPWKKASSPGAQTRSSDADREENHEGDPNGRGADPDVLRAADLGEKSPVCVVPFFDSERVTHVSFCTFAFLRSEVDQGRELVLYLCTLRGHVLE